MASLRDRIATQRGTKPRVAREAKPVKQSPLEFIKEHPFKTLTQPVSKTLGLPTIKELYEERIAPRVLRADSPLPRPLQIASGTILGTEADIADIGQTPLSYIPLPIGKLLGKIPIKGTTLGRIAKTIPVGRGFGKSVKELGRFDKALKSLPARVAASRAPLRPRNPVQRVITALKEARPIRGQQEAIFSLERGRRLKDVIRAGKEVSGEAGFKAQLGKLKGKLPRVQYEGLRGKISQPDIDDLFNVVENHQAISPFEKITAKKGLSKLLGAEGVTVPTRGELNLLKEMFPEELIQTIASKQPLLQKVGQGIAEVINIPRAIMSSADLSAPLRQGVFLIGRPKQFLSSFKDMFKYAFSEKSYQGLLHNIKKRPTYALMQESKLPLTELGGALSSREEAFMSQLPEKIPVFGKIIRGSNRAYTGFLNKLRADVFDDLIKSAKGLGLKVEGKVANDISTFVGAATGRGKLPSALSKAAVTLNSVFFSPRLMASRLNLMNPVFYTRLHPFVRKEALKSLLTFAGTATSVMGLAKLGGADVGADPRSADFGKIKVGNTRYDVLGGFQQYIRLAAQLITGEHISSTTGVKTTLGEGFKPVTRYDILGRFLETKEAPVASLATMMLKGSGRFGEELNVPREVGQRFIPMVVQDMFDLVKERGVLKGVAAGAPAVFGVGVQTYAPTASDMVYSANSVKNSARSLMKQGKMPEALSLLQQNKKMIEIGGILEPMQRNIRRYEKLKKETKKNARLTAKRKSQLVANYDSNIQALTKQLEQQYKALR